MFNNTCISMVSRFTETAAANIVIPDEDLRTFNYDMYEPQGNRKKESLAPPLASKTPLP